MDVRFHELENKACCTRLRMIAAETVSDEGEQDEQDKLAIDRAYLIRKKALEWAFRLYDIKSSDALSEETKLERSENLKKEMVSEIEKAYDPRYLMEKEWEMRKYEIQRSKTLSSETKEEQLKELEEQFQEKLRNISENPKYLIPETRRIHAGDSIRIAERYAVCESDRPHRWDIFTPSLRNVRHSEELTVKNFIPDYIEYEQTPVYDDKENLVAEGTLSVVRISTGKPSITQKAAKTNLKLFTLVQYGKMILRERLKDGHKIRVEGCIYFLQKKNDSNGENPTFDEDFFKETNGLNIVRQSDDYEADGGRTPHEQEMDEIIHGFVEGMDPEAVGKSECEKCKYFYVCNYEKAPVPFTKVAEEKKIDIKKFSKEQKAAVNFQKGIMLINAGAGTGKTAVMSMAPVVLLKQGVIPESLFMSTFSRSGMEETGPRVQYNLRQHGLGDDYDRIRIQTLHSFGYECIKKVWKKLGFSEEPAVADEVEKNDLIASLLANNVIPGLDYRNPEINFKNSMGAITVISKTFEIIKRGEKGMSFTKKDIDTVWKKLGKVRRYIKADKSVLNQVFDLYDIFQKELRERNLVEYSDMEILLVEYLKQDPHFLDQFKFRHILIDEFQDSSGAQVELLKALCKCPTFESLRVVGDDWQSVGAFRGVTPEYMINFEKIMAEEGFNVQVVKLERNYRCRPEILKAAMKMISKNKNRLKKVLKAVRKSCGLDVVVKGFYSVNEEREFIRNDIKKHLDDGLNPGNIMVLARNKYEPEQIVKSLDDNVRRVMKNPNPVIDNCRVQAAISLIDAIKNPQDNRAVIGYVNATLGGTFFELSQEERREEVETVREAIEVLKERKGKEQRKMLLDLLSLIDQEEDEIFQWFYAKLEARQTYASIVDYIFKFRLYGQDVRTRRSLEYDSVTGNTCHSAKGSEASVVYLMTSKFDASGDDVEDDEDEENHIEEMRRLLFVGMTRARDELIITGQFYNGKEKSEDGFGKKQETLLLNQFLGECYEAVGQEYDPQKIAEEKADREAAEKKLKNAAKKARLKETVAAHKNEAV